MAITEPTPPPTAGGAGIGPDELHLQVQKIAASPVFAGSEILRNLLVFCAKAAIERPGEGVREQDIATGVLERNDFDARIDSSVRVHVGRLRARLAEYYQGPGSGDSVVVEISKGSYRLTASRRVVAASSTQAQPVLPKPGPVIRWTHPRLWATALMSITVVVVCLFALRWPLDRWLHSQPPGVSNQVRHFWKAFLDADRPTLVIFGSPRPSHGDGAETASSLAHDGLSSRYPGAGAGAVISIHQLTRLFDHLGRDLHVKHSLHVTWDDARREPLILIGGPLSNAAYTVLPRPQRFVFRPGSSDRESASIEDLQASGGQTRHYYSAIDTPRQLDYALVAFIPALTDRHPALILAGITTLGTQAAGEFVTEDSTLAQLFSRLQAETRPVPYFEALLRVTIHNGAPIRTELLAVYPLAASPKDTPGSAGNPSR